MKKILLLAMTLFSLNSFAQKSDSSTIKVVYQQQTADPDVAVFLNGKLAMHVGMPMFDPNMIDHINVFKNDTTIDGHNYKGQLWIDLKKEYKPTFISLNKLKHKYTNVKDAPSIFMIDGQIIANNYNEMQVDEKYILKIEVSKIRNPEEKVDMDLIKLLTRSEENIRKSKEIIIRGNGAVPAGDYMDNVRQKVTADRRTL